MAEIERRAKPKLKEQVSFFREAWMLLVGVATVVGALIVFLINYGVVYPMVKSEIEEYHEGFTNQDGIILKTDLGYIKRDMEKIIATQELILKLLLEGGDDNTPLSYDNVFSGIPGNTIAQRLEDHRFFKFH